MINVKNEIGKIIEFQPKYQKETYQFVWNRMIEDVGKNPKELKVELHPLENIAQNYLNNHNKFWIYTHENKIIGTISVIKVNECCYFLERFYVDKKHRNQGVGEKLYQAVESYVRNNKGINITLYAGKKLLKAHQFYLKHGFILIQDKESEYEFKKNLV